MALLHRAMRRILPLLQVADMPMFISAWQVHSVAAVSPPEPVQHLLSFTGPRIMQHRGSQRSSMSAPSALLAASVALEAMRQSPGIDLLVRRVSSSIKSRAGNDGSRSQSAAALVALAKVAASEGSVATRSLVIGSNTAGSNPGPHSAARHATFNGNVLHHPCLLPAAALQPAPAVVARSRQRGTAIISGGLGGLGLLTAHWITQLGSHRLILLGRSGRSSSRTSEELCDSACEVTMGRCDVSVAAEAAAVIMHARQHGHTSRVIHAGGVLRDGLLASQTPAGLRHVFAPKVAGLQNLAHGLDGAQFTLFSSIAGVLGSSGQGNYAAANAWMDAWAADRADQVCHRHVCSARQLSTWPMSCLVS